MGVRTVSRKHIWHAGLLAAGLISSVWMGGLVSAASFPSSSFAVTALPAFYGFTKTVTLTNNSSNAAFNVKAQVVLLPPRTAYAHVSLTGYSRPAVATYYDRSGNLVGTYEWSQIAPHQSVTVTLHYQATSSDISYHLPVQYPPYSTASAIVQRYTNPSLEARQVETDAPAIEALDQSLVGGVTNPYQRASVLFQWVAQHIRYNYSDKASGSALATLRARRGVCSDIAELYVSMLRTDQIPARLINGYVTNNGRGHGGLHQWVEFYLPSVGWVVADPTWRAGYFAELQDDWHVPLYVGLRPAISVQWQAGGGDTRLGIAYHYHFVTEQSPFVTRRVNLPVLSVDTAIVRHRTAGHQSSSGGLAQVWHRTEIWLGQYWLRARILWRDLGI